jgi:hypothetical protein
MKRLLYTILNCSLLLASYQLSMAQTFGWMDIRGSLPKFRYDTAIVIPASSELSLGQPPKLSGTVHIDVDKGLIHCSFNMTHFPQMEDPAFCLNKGFNLKDIQQDGQSINYNEDWGLPFKNSFLREAIGYFPENDTLKTETIISLTYSGAFPVYNKNERVRKGDGMSTIAIKNGIIRASHQALWYPVLVDRATNTTFTKVTYDIEIVCTKRRTIYLGGSIPVTANKRIFKSSEPNDLMLYVGKYSFGKTGNTYFLNSDLSENQKQTVDASLEKIRKYYAELFDIEYSQPLVLAQIFSIGPENQYENWAFAAYPCIVADLSELPNQINEQTHDISDIHAFRLYSHELAHQFFGLKVKSDNAFWGFYSESLAEFMCLKAIENSFGKEIYKSFVKDRYLGEDARSKDYIQLDKVNSEIDDVHKYRYYPMVLLGLEQEVGQERMFAFLKYIVRHSQGTNLTYETLRQAGIDSGIAIDEWNEFEKKYIQVDNCLKVVAERM